MNCEFKKTMNFTFKKTERLCSKKTIEALFEGGHKSMSAYPIRAVFMPVGEQSSDTEPEPQGATPCVGHTQLLISVSKRRFKHAVDRNRVKRQLREAYRLNKHLVLDRLPDGVHLAIAFLWLCDEHFKSEVIHNKVKKLLMRIAEEYEHTK